jgi:hypothetical protein
LDTAFFKPKKLAANLIEKAGSDLQLCGADEHPDALNIEEYYWGAIENNHNIK